MDIVPIISYQAITGNNNHAVDAGDLNVIISYQAITGNNNCFRGSAACDNIISYQAITGNNNDNGEMQTTEGLYHTKR